MEMKLDRRENLKCSEAMQISGIRAHENFLWKYRKKLKCYEAMQIFIIKLSCMLGGNKDE
jgi:hypothetical protein